MLDPEATGFDDSSDASQAGEGGKTALHIAADRGDLTMVKIMLHVQVEVDPRDWQGMTPLHYAVRRGHTPVAALLISRGADINTPNQKGWTSLHIAVDAGRAETVHMLLSKGADHRLGIMSLR